MKYSKTLLLGSVAAIALAACSSLDVDGTVIDNYPTGFTYAGYLAANPDLVDLQYMDQVEIYNAQYTLNYSDDAVDVSAAKKSDEDAFVGDTAQMVAIGETYGGFAKDFLANSENITGRVVTYLKKFNVYGTTNDLDAISKMVIDTTAIVEQYLAYGKKEGRPFRICAASEMGSLVKKGDCQSDDAGYYLNHLYCADEATKVTYCLDCDASFETCPEVVAPTSSSAAKPASSAAAEGDADADSSASEGDADASVDSSASEGDADANPESSADAAADPEAGEPTTESSSSVTE